MQKELGFDATAYDVIANIGTSWWQLTMLYVFILLSVAACIYCIIHDKQKTINRIPPIGNVFFPHKYYFTISSTILICSLSVYLYSKGYAIYYFVKNIRKL